MNLRSDTPRTRLRGTRTPAIRVADIALVQYLLIAIAFDDGSIPVQAARLVLIFGALTELVSKPVRAGKVILWQALFVVYAAISTAWSVEPSNAWAMTQTLVVNGICIGAVAYLVNNDSRRLKAALAAIMIGPVLLMLRVASEYGLLAFLDTRATGATSANTVGMTAAFAFGLAYLGFTQRTLAARWVCGLLLVANLSITVLSGSRKALVITALVLLLYSILGGGPRRASRFTKFLIALACTGFGYWLVMNVPLFYSLLGRRFETMLNGFLGSGIVDSSTETRMGLIEAGIGWFTKSPWFGHGGDNYRVLTELYRPGITAQYSHNNFIELLVNFGVVGLLLFYWLYVSIIRTGLKKRRTLQPIQAMLLGMVITLLFVEYGFVSYFNRVFMAVVTIAWVAVCTRTLELESPFPDSLETRSPKNRALRSPKSEVPGPLH